MHIFLVARTTKLPSTYMNDVQLQNNKTRHTKDRWIKVASSGRTIRHGQGRARCVYQQNTVCSSHTSTCVRAHRTMKSKEQNTLTTGKESGKTRKKYGRPQRKLASWWCNAVQSFIYCCCEAHKIVPPNLPTPHTPKNYNIASKDEPN